MPITFGLARSQMPSSLRPILNEELSAADQRCRTLEIDLVVPAYDLRPSGRDHRHRRRDSLAGDRCDRRRAGPCAGRLRLSDAAFEEPDLDFLGCTHLHVFDVRTLWKLRLRLDYCRLALPSLGEIADENFVASRIRCARFFAETELPKISSWLGEILAGSDTVFSVRNEEF